MKFYPWLVRMAWVVGLIGAGRLVAQDLTVAPLQWVDPSDPPDIMPVITYWQDAAVPKGMEQSSGYAYMMARVVTTEKGQGGPMMMETTDTRLFPAVTFGRKRNRPARRKGKAVNSDVWSAVIFNPKSARPAPDNMQPRLLRVTPVIWHQSPKGFTATTLQAQVMVTQQGGDGDAKLPETVSAGLKATALRALEAWVFSPAKRDGQIVEARIEVPVLVLPELQPMRPDDSEPPKVIRQVSPVYPFSQQLAGYDGEVLVDFTVDIEGRVREAHVVASTNPAFDEPAITAVLQWRYKPALRNGSPVNCHIQIPIIFSLHGGGSSAFRVQASKKNQQSLPPELRFDTAPEVRNMQPAVYPFDALMAKRRGKVEFLFAVNTLGRAMLVKTSTGPEDSFTAAVRAMVDELRFKPALKDGKPTNAMLRMKLDFDEDNGEVALSDSAKRLLRGLRKPDGIKRLLTLPDIDEPPRPISQKMPGFPTALRGSVDHGETEIEFIIDQYGIAQLPHILSASDPAFGYAACQAIATWRFTPPRRAGQAVPVRVIIPVGFKLK